MLFLLCNSETAYILRFEVYLGKARDIEDISATGSGAAVILRLTKDFHYKGHCLLVNNWYSSIAPGKFMRSRGIYLHGTTKIICRRY